MTNEQINSLILRMVDLSHAFSPGSWPAMQLMGAFGAVGACTYGHLNENEIDWQSIKKFVDSHERVINVETMQ